MERLPWNTEDDKSEIRCLERMCRYNMGNNDPRRSSCMLKMINIYEGKCSDIALYGEDEVHKRPRPIYKIME